MTAEPYQEAVEALARALYEHEWGDQLEGHPWPELPKFIAADDYRDAARVVLTVVRGAIVRDIVNAIQAEAIERDTITFSRSVDAVVRFIESEFGGDRHG